MAAASLELLAGKQCGAHPLRQADQKFCGSQVWQGQRSGPGRPGLEIRLGLAVRRPGNESSQLLQRECAV